MKFNDVVRFMRREDLQQVCPICGNKKWEIDCGDSDQNVATDSETEVKRISAIEYVELNEHNTLTLRNDSTPIINVFCSHCGYLRSHAYGVISNWVNDNPDKNQDK